MSNEETKDSENLPLLLTTAEAARYIAGVKISNKRPVKAKKFMEFAKHCGIVPKYESKTLATRYGETFIYHKRLWSRAEIDKALGCESE